MKPKTNKTNKKIKIGKWPYKTNVQVKGSRSPSITEKAGYIKKYKQNYNIYVTSFHFS